MQDAGLLSASDPEVLIWSAAEGRILLTHDVSTMTQYTYERLSTNQPMPGLFIIARSVPIGQAVEALFLIYECSTESEWYGNVFYLPFD